MKMTDTTIEPTTKVLTPEAWAELGRAIARQMAESWGSEWKPHCWDDVWEARDGKWPDLDAARPQLTALFQSDDENDWTRYEELKDALYEGWRDELKRQLRAKRDSRSIDDVGLSSEDSRIDRPPRHLLLADGTTIAGWLRRDAEGKPLFDFRLSRSKEVTISIPEDAEFSWKRLEYRGAGFRTARLQLIHEDAGYRHYLGRRDVHCGYGLRCVPPDGNPIDGRYECNLSRADCEPIFYFTLAGGIDGVQRVLRMPHDAEYVLEGRAL